jgi:hypothetical protein
MIVIVGMGVIVSAAHLLAFKMVATRTVHKTVIADQPNPGTLEACSGLSLRSSINLEGVF